MGRYAEVASFNGTAPSPKVLASSGRGGGRGGEERKWRGAGYKDVGRGGGRSGSGGAQRWWDPAWRDERTRQLQGEIAPEEEINEKEWWGKLEKLKTGQEGQEIVIKSNYGRNGALVLKNFAQQLELHFHAYNQGRNTAIVISNNPLPSCRPDLDERQDNTTERQILMSAATEFRVETMLSNLRENNVAIPKGKTQGTALKSPMRSPARPNKFPASNLSKMSAADKEARNMEIQEYQSQLQASAAGQAMQAFRETLPAYKLKEEFLEAVYKNQVVVVSGDTGCGKTTQLPQFLLEKEIKEGRVADCNIICTQPRRISAMSVATRVAAERGDALGQSVGYQIRLESKRSPQTRLLFSTTGMFLRHLLKEPLLIGVNHVMVDEIHERGMNEDFLLIMLREVLPRRPDLRLVLMSATFNAKLFSSYFGDALMMNIPGFMFPVKELFLEDVLELIGHTLNSDEASCPGAGERQKKEFKMDPLVEAFENVDIDTEYEKYSESTQLSLHSWTRQQTGLSLVEKVIEHICVRENEGAILVFLSGWDEISKLVDRLRANAILKDKTRFLMLPLHGSMPTMNQRLIFQSPQPGVRKIVLATNIAETSITIDDIVYVIDCGKAKESSYDVLNKLACLRPSWIAKSSANQRRGRAGRVKAGTCYHLYPKLIYGAMPQYQLPEILRTPLPELCLQMKFMHLGNVHYFLKKAMEPPDVVEVQNALELLMTMEALDDEGELTPLGTHLATLPVDPKIGKILLMGALFQCLAPALTIAAAISYRDPFVCPDEHKDEAEEARKRFSNDQYSDHIATLNAYDGWLAAKQNGAERSYCWDNYLSLSTLQILEEMRYQFLNILADINFVDKSRNHQIYNKYSQDMEMVKAVICAGLFPNVVMCKTRNKHLAFYTKEEGRVEPQPSSLMSRVQYLPLPWLLYTGTVRGTCYVRELTNVSDYTLLMFGGHLVCSKNGQSAEMLGGFLHFSASRRATTIIIELRKQLELLLDQKLRDPTHFDIHLQAKPVVIAVFELIHSNNTSSKSDGLHGASWGQEEDHIYSTTNKIPLRRYPSPIHKKIEGRLGPLDNLFKSLIAFPADLCT